MPKVIKIQDKTLEEINNHREYKRETWDDLIVKILDLTKDNIKKKR